MRLVFIWTSNYFFWKTNQTPWLAFLVCYYTISEIVPFTIFCVVLLFRIVNYRSDFRRMQSNYKMLNRTISETDCLKDGSDVDEDDRKSSGVID